MDTGSLNREREGNGAESGSVDSKMKGRSAVSHQRRKLRAERDGLVLVLSLVRSGRAVTRLDIEQVAGLSRAVVTDRLATLIASGLVVEGDLGISTGGRAPRHVRFGHSAGYILVGSLGTTTLGVGLADLSGKLVVEHHEPADVTTGAAQTLDRIEALFQWLLDEHPEANPPWGIGLGLPGQIGLAGGALSSRATIHMMPGWDEYPVRERLSTTFNAPVWLDSEVNVTALGELRAGRGVKGDDLLFIKIGTGISVGLCASGRLHRGAQGYAGDIGHIAVDVDSGVICRCGNTGCLEALAGGAAVGYAGHLAGVEGRSQVLAEIEASGRAVTASDVGMAAQRGDPFSIELLARSGRLIGETLATLVNAYNPSLVVVGGGVAQAGEILLAAMREAVYRRSRSLATRDLRIVRSEMGKTAGLMGAAFAVADELFSSEYLRTWIDKGWPRRSTSEHTRVAIATPGRADQADGSVQRPAAQAARVGRTQ